VIQFLTPTISWAGIILFFSVAIVSSTINFFSTLRITLKSSKFLTLILIYLHAFFGGFFYQVFLLYTGSVKIPVSLIPIFSLSTWIFSIINLSMLFLLLVNIFTSTFSTSSSIHLEQSIESITFNGPFDSGGNDTSALRKSLLFNFKKQPTNSSTKGSDTLFYLKNEKRCTFIVELKNFDYKNRTTSQLNSIQNALADGIKLLDPTDTNTTLDFFKISHIDIDEFDKAHLDGTEKKEPHSGAKIDRIFLQYSFVFNSKNKEDKEIETKQNAIKFLNYLDYLLKQNVKMFPILPGRLVVSQWFKYFEHTSASKNQNKILSRLKVLDHYLNVLKFGENHAHYESLNIKIKKLLPDLSTFIESLQNKIQNNQFLLPPSIFSFLNVLISYSFSNLNSESSIMVNFYKPKTKTKNLVSPESFESSFIPKDIGTTKQYLSVYNAVDFEKFDLEGNEFTSIFKNSGHDSVTVSMSLEGYNKTEIERELKFNSLLRYKQVHGRFRKEIISADDYHRDFVKKLIVLIRDNNNNNVVKSFVFKKTTLQNPVFISTIDLFTAPQKLDYVFDDNPGFTFRLLYGQNKEFFNFYLNNSYKNSSFLGSEGFMATSDVLGYIGPFTQDTSIDRASSTRIVIGKNIQSNLEVSVDMSEYRNSDESVGTSNGHIVVIGKSGSGKTYLTESLLFQKGLTKNLYIFDIENEYNDFDKDKSVIETLLRSKDEARKLLKKEALKRDYLDEYNLMSEDRVINMFDLNCTDDQLKQMLKGDFKEQPLTYQKHRDFLITFIKELVNIHTNNFDVEIGYCIDQTYTTHYSKYFKNQKSYDPNIFNSIQYYIESENLLGKTLNDLLKALFNNNLKLNSQKSPKEGYILYPRVEDFKNAVSTRIKEIEKFTLNTDSQVNHFEYLYEIEKKLALLLVDDYWNKKFNMYSNVSLNKEVIIFNLKSLLNISGVVQFSKWSLMLLLNFLFVTTFDKELDSKDKDSKGIFLVIDEAHRYLRPELMQMVDFMADVSKRGRKRYVEMCIVSQNISDFYRESDSKDLMQKARDVVRNSAYKFIFQIGSEFKDALQFVEAGFQITEADQNYIKQLYRGQCYFVQGPLDLTKVFVIQDPRMPKKN
jgi:DNA helicase HerA-like ATPase